MKKILNLMTLLRFTDDYMYKAVELMFQHKNNRKCRLLKIKTLRIT